MSNRLKGKTAIVTGSASGIGAGAAQRFAEEGANLVLIDVDHGGLDRVAGAITASGFDRPAICAGDIADVATASAAVNLALEQTGRVDVLVNNAGIMDTGDPLQFDESAWDRTMAVNVRGVYALIRAGLPTMLVQRQGAIVNTSSVMASLTEPHHEAYTTSKAAVIGLTKAIAVTYAERGIRSNAICPGWVDTPMNLALKQQPLGRMVTVREVANAILFLASDEASGITGAVLRVDGAAGSAI
jgi:NAD(P)-dependent dehydrogenase (short-subunit alcohol dehydrogenase family)